jgi:hypothetical protein
VSGVDSVDQDVPLDAWMFGLRQRFEGLAVDRLPPDSGATASLN